jgi:response regulator RpfG family c-di-GMP phosphodiesterase
MNAPTEKILFVDDDLNILSGYMRALRKRCQFETAVGGEEGLMMLEHDGPFAVVISDRQMPQIDGVKFLSQVKQKSPDTVRIMLTGNADLESTIELVNQGNLFRFLTKPCSVEVIGKAIDDALTQYRIVTAERELLEKTLRGSVQVLVEILSIVDPNSFGRAQRLKDRIGPLAKAMGLPNTWELELAAMLSQIGHVTIPTHLTSKGNTGQALTAIEREMLESVPEIGRRLLMNIPRLQNVAEIVLYQRKHFNGGGYPMTDISGDAIPLGSRLLLIMQDLLQLEDSGSAPNQAVDQLAKRQGRYDPKLLELLAKNYAGKVWRKEELIRQVPVKALQIGDTLVTDVFNQDGMLLMTSGHKLTGATLEKLLNFAMLYGVKEPLSVY